MHWDPIRSNNPYESRHCRLSYNYTNKHVWYPNLIFLVQWFSNFTMSSFFIYCYFIEICLLHWVSVTKEILSWSQKTVKNTLFVTNQFFLCHTDSVRQTSYKEMAKNAKKEDMVKIENRCTKKIRLGYLVFLWQINVFFTTDNYVLLYFICITTDSDSYHVGYLYYYRQWLLPCELLKKKLYHFSLLKKIPQKTIYSIAYLYFSIK